MRHLTLLAAAALSLAACNNPGTSNDTNKATPPGKPTLADVPASPAFPGAALTMSSATATMQGKDSAKVSFAFDVKNYELKMQTGDASGKLCNNSDKGQHIHFILDNKPYVALYEPKNEVTVPLNTEHYLMCFLSRSYHESIKEPGVSVLYHFKVDEKGAIQKLDDPKTPMLFYSRPKGDYLGKDTANILLDFYLTNAALGADYSVKADVKNETLNTDTSFTLKEWKPKFIQNLRSGKCSVTLTLMGKDGKPVDGPNTTMTRNFQLAASEPLK